MSRFELIHIGPVHDRPRKVAIFGPLPPEKVFSVENHGPFQNPERVAPFGLLPEKTEVPQSSVSLNSDAAVPAVPRLRLIQPEDSMVQDNADKQQAR